MQIGFAFPTTRVTDPETSHEAASLAAQGASILRARCYRALLEAEDGLTDFELADQVGSQQTSAGKRRGELRDAGLVEWAGSTRRAPSGAQARVWKAVAK